MEVAGFLLQITNTGVDRFWTLRYIGNKEKPKLISMIPGSFEHPKTARQSVCRPIVMYRCRSRHAIASHFHMQEV